MKKQLLTLFLAGTCMASLAQSNLYFKTGLITDLSQLNDGDYVVLQNVNTGFTERNGYVEKNTDAETLKTNVNMFSKPEANEFKNVFNNTAVFRITKTSNETYTFYNIAGSAYLLNNLGKSADAQLAAANENNEFYITLNEDVEKAWSIKSVAKNGMYLHGESQKTIFYDEPHPYRIIKVAVSSSDAAPQNWYSVWNSVRATYRMYIDANNHNFVGMKENTQLTPTAEDYLWTIVEDPQNPEKCTFVLKGQPSGSVNWTGLDGSGNITNTHTNTNRFAYDTTEKHCNLNMTKPSGSPYPYATFKFQPEEEKGSALYVNQAAGGQGYYLNYYSNNDGTYAFTFTINAQLRATGNGYALGSFIAPYQVAIPTGVEVYTATETGTDLLLTKQEGTSIPANTAVILKAETAGFYEMLPAGEDATDIDATGNILKGCAYDREITPTEGAYVLGQVDETTGMFNYTGATIPMYRAYLPKNASTQQIKKFIFDGDGTTGITEIAADSENTAIYDLCGRKVQAPGKGIYIKNGKKFIVK